MLDFSWLGADAFWALGRGAATTLILIIVVTACGTVLSVVGAAGRFGPHRMVRAFIRDRRAARESVDRLLRWDFDRVIVSHGDVLETGGRDRLAEGFAFL